MSSYQAGQCDVDNDSDDVVGIIDMSNGEDKQYEGICHIAGYGSDLDLHSFMQQQWNELYNGWNQWNAEELDGSCCPPLPMVQGGPSLGADCCPKLPMTQALVQGGPSLGVLA